MSTPFLSIHATQQTFLRWFVPRGFRSTTPSLVYYRDSHGTFVRHSRDQHTCTSWCSLCRCSTLSSTLGRSLPSEVSKSGGPRHTSAWTSRSPQTTACWTSCILERGHQWRRSSVCLVVFPAAPCCLPLRLSFRLKFERSRKKSSNAFFCFPPFLFCAPQSSRPLLASQPEWGVWLAGPRKGSPPRQNSWGSTWNSRLRCNCYARCWYRSAKFQHLPRGRNYWCTSCRRSSRSLPTQKSAPCRAWFCLSCISWCSPLLSWRAFFQGWVCPLHWTAHLSRASKSRAAHFSPQFVLLPFLVSSQRLWSPRGRPHWRLHL